MSVSAIATITILAAEKIASKPGTPAALAELLGLIVAVLVVGAGVFEGVAVGEEEKGACASTCR